MISSFLDSPALPRPLVSVDEAARIAAVEFGVTGGVTELGSNQDRNFRIDAEDGRYVLKVANPAFDPEELAAQNAALDAARGTGLAVPAVVAAPDGRTVIEVEAGGQRLHVRLLGYVEGTPLTGDGRFGSGTRAALGAAGGALAAALAGLEHPGLARGTQWNLEIAGEVVGLLLPAVPQADRRDAVAAATDAALARLAPLRAALRRQPIHGDLTDDNVVRVGDAAMSGVIDFGDVAESWLVAELAVTCASVLHHNPDQPLAILDTVTAFAAEMPLTEEEADALWPLIVLRTAVLVVSGEQQVTLDGDNDYADINRAAEERAFRVAAAQDPDVMAAVLRRTLGGGEPAPVPAAEAPLLPGLGEAVTVDLSVPSRALGAGLWLSPDADTQIVAAARADGRAALTRWGEHRLTRSRLRSAEAPATLTLGVEVHVSAGQVTAPVGGTVRHAGDALVLGVAGGGELWLTGLADRTTESSIAPGAPLGQARGPLTVQFSRLGGPRPPLFAAPGDGATWRLLCPDPSPLLGVAAAAPEPDPSGALAARDSSFGAVQEHYYADPPQIERGWREHLVDVHGRAYVDLVNNVTSIGHGHPRLVDAVAGQWALLNTNSRFHYGVLAQFTERLASLAPDGLDTVFLVNSGSEAVDLALRLATAATGAPTVLALREAYHGWTLGSDAVSSSLGDNPGALDSRPDWVRLVENPNPYRGRHRGADSAPAYLADLERQLDGMAAEGVRLAGLIAEPIFGNGGGVLLPDGYLRGAFDLVRARGGICIADEVQVGYGRLGDWFWGFEQQGAVPDVITIAKAMGNGHPLGAVITRREIADSLAAEGSLFSSAGGSPVSCVVGLTVLDVLEEEGLQDNARAVGGHLRSELLRLGERHPLIGAVHGHGLYLGVELVRDRASAEPATEEAARVCDELLAEGCIVQPTGDGKNVLKIKPPMCITRESADFFVSALDRVLSRVG
ncbi:MAG TPA: aminotransferase [Naasia sp.]|jgi:4-aminobutyrate aminotransferase-like enzyme/Ser/Thr protein kinase RdoA (MazF antagonist)